jgi:hypothetical protein
MSVHPANGTGACHTDELKRTSQPVVTSQMLKRPLDQLVDAQFENDRQAMLVFNPSPERDSIIEHLAAMVRDGADTATVKADLDRLVSELYASNQLERGHVHSSTGQIDLLHRTLHNDGQRTSLPVKAAARMLRPHLRVIGRAKTELVPAGEFFPASCAIKVVIGLLPSETLRGKFLRHELGAGPHDVLLSLLTDGADQEA